MYERRHEPLLTRRRFLNRLAGSFAVGLAMVVVVLAIGVAGYHFLEGMPWIDAFLNAAMILGGMGPVGELKTAGGKLFAACYALLSGLFILVVAGVMFAPVVHRFLHKFHLESASREKR
jgi:hypothetical protein